MKTNNLYKYINLLLRIIIGVAAVWFIYIKLNDDFIIQFQQISLDNINYSLIVVVILMLFVNWGVEAMKWRYAIRSLEMISIFKSFKLTITGITMGLLTPNRVGEIPARALLLNTDLFKEITLKTAVSSFSQVLITLLLGIVGLILTYHFFNFFNPISLIAILTLGLIILLLIYFKISSLERLFNRINYFREKEIFKALSTFSFRELINLLFFSFLRYVVFFIQFYLILKAFNIVLISINEVLLIPVCFMLTSFIPTILLSEIGVRGSVALLVFGTVSDMDIHIVLASVLLWLINVALPALMGLFNLRQLKIMKEN
ncbi:MAG: hypothetical protein COA97_09890 [Flavobacteriales bacterium]|nr:MAG: hypothetical protein COA97_09890 [Flavobacteriales bacterium]